jgi:hypothetical protein
MRALLALSLCGCSLFTSLDDLRGGSLPVVGDAGDASSDAPPPAPGIYVDAKLGSDTSAGSYLSPFKTLGHALGIAKSGDTIFVRPGTYDAANGETFATFIADGVAIQATGDGVVVSGDTTKTAFSFAGSGTIDGVATSSFFTVVKATSGSQTISHAKIDGASLAVDASGSAHVQISTTTSSGCSAFATAGGTSSLDVKGAQILGAGGAGAFVIDARDGAGVSLDTMSVSAASSTNVVHASGTSTVSLTGCTFASSSSSTGVRAEAGTTLTIVSGSFKGLAGGVVTSTKTTITGVEISGSTNSGVTILDGANVSVTNATIAGNGNGGFYVQAAHLVLRGTHVTGNTGGGIWTNGFTQLDLGASQSEPGNNTFGANGTSSLDVTGSTNSEFLAKGNTWDPSVQGADAQGLFGPGTIITATTGASFAALGGQMIYVGF